MRENDDVRLHLVRIPEMAATITESPDQWNLCTVRVELTSSEPVDRLDIRVGDTSALILGPSPGGTISPGAQAHWPARLQWGEAATWSASVIGDGGQRVRIWVTCWRGAESWQPIPLDLDLPADPMRTIFVG